MTLPRSLCVGQMAAVFDDATDGDDRAARQALQICALCPRLEACQEDLRAWQAMNVDVGRVMAGTDLQAPRRGQVRAPQVRHRREESHA